jgi:hypothetical protein
MKKVVFLLLLAVLFSSNVFANNIRFFGGAGAPYGFGGVNTGYLLGKNLELSAGMGFANTYLGETGEQLYPYMLGVKIYMGGGGYWDPDFSWYMSCYYGAVDMLHYMDYVENQYYYEMLPGVCFGYGFKKSLNFIVDGLWTDFGLIYLIPTKTLPDDVVNNFRIINYYIGCGINF